MPRQLSVLYLAQILRGWENQNRANIASVREQLRLQAAWSITSEEQCLGLGLKLKCSNWNYFSVVLSAETSQRPQTLFILSPVPEAPIHSYTEFKYCSCSFSSFHNAVSYSWDKKPIAHSKVEILYNIFDGSIPLWRVKEAIQEQFRICMITWEIPDGKAST